jgi:hypothetical protein
LAKAASSSVKLWTAKAWWMCATDRIQPMRTGDGAGLFSTRTFAIG